MRLTGLIAVQYCEARGGSEFGLRKYADPIEGPRDNITPKYARDVISQDPSLVYLDCDPEDPDHDRIMEEIL